MIAANGNAQEARGIGARGSPAVIPRLIATDRNVERSEGLAGTALAAEPESARWRGTRRLVGLETRTSERRRLRPDAGEA
jgi:hypothetical protein